MNKRLVRGYAYADDTQMLLTAKNVQELYTKIKNNEEIIEKEMGKAGIYLNVGKQLIMLMKKKRVVAAPPIQLSCGQKM